jgi:hypothetical protein
MKLKYISHRGNLRGREESLENSPTHILRALALGFDVEIDVWSDEGNNWWLGHDGPQYHIPFDFLKNDCLWCHAKNVQAIEGMLKDKDIHCFWHQHDDRTLTSKGYVWTYIGKPLTTNAICIMPDIDDYNDPLGYILPLNIAGVCSDYINNIKYNLPK